MATKSICLYFQVHQPDRLRLFRFFDIGADDHYFDDFDNSAIVRRVAAKCYLPMNKLILELIKAKGVRTCLTINPDIDAGRLVPYLDRVDMVLLMSVFAGFGGQAFIPETMDRIRFIRQEIDRRGLLTLIEVDGGVNTHNAAEIFAAGADVLVAGSAVFGAPNPEEAIRRMKA